MFFVLPTLAVIGIYVAAAVLPAAFLVRSICRMDRGGKEPASLLVRLVICGAAAAMASMALESINARSLAARLTVGNPAYTILMAFLVIAATEEGTKFFFLRYATRREASFDRRFDAIVYAVFVSLGFAVFENLRSAFGYGLGVAYPRAILAIPGHMGFAVFMGVFYGRAMACRRVGNRKGMRLNLLLGQLAAVLLHGFYDACALIGTVFTTVLFVLFVAVLYVAVIYTVRRESARDAKL